ncbi:MAG: GDP-mannose 4,6-dehydratase [Candidatus Eisenbacteria bacterium]
MNVLVTGAGGFVGPHLVRALAARGHAAWGSGLEPAPPPSLAGDAAVVGWTRWDVADEGDDAIAGLFARGGAVDAVVHLAGQASAARSFEDPLGTARVNFGGTLRLLEAARRAAFTGPLVVAGSSEAYGRIADGRPCDEDTPLAPLSPYGVSKAAADHATRVYAQSFGLRAVVTRAFSHTGPGQSPAFALASWARQVADFEAGAERGDRGPFRLQVGNLEPVRDYGDVRDVARAYALLLEKGAPGTAYNVATGRGVKLRDVVGLLLAAARVPIEVEEDAARLRPNDLTYLVGDPTRLSAATGWSPAIPLAETLSALLEDARSARASLIEGGA